MYWAHSRTSFISLISQMAMIYVCLYSVHSLSPIKMLHFFRPLRQLSLAILHSALLWQPAEKQI